MMNFIGMVKRWDVIVILVLVFLSFFPIFIFTYIQASNTTDNSQHVAIVSVNGEGMKRITLTGNSENYTLNIPDVECNPNTVEVNMNKIRIKNSTCPEQICVLTGYISTPGPAIICLPHKVVIEIDTINGDITDEIIISS